MVIVIGSLRSAMLNEAQNSQVVLYVWILVIKFKINKQTTETSGALFPQVRLNHITSPMGTTLSMQLQIAT